MRARRPALLFGLRAERIAAVWLTLRFYKILASRYAAHGGEIDLVAMRGDTIVFVEVKGRRRLEDAATAITAMKRQRMARAARHWLVRNPWAAQKTFRGDAVFVAPRQLPRHVVNAFELALF